MFVHTRSLDIRTVNTLSLLLFFADCRLFAQTDQGMGHGRRGTSTGERGRKVFVGGHPRQLCLHLQDRPGSGLCGSYGCAAGKEVDESDVVQIMYAKVVHPYAACHRRERRLRDSDVRSLPCRELYPAGCTKMLQYQSCDLYG